MIPNGMSTLHTKTGLSDSKTINSSLQEYEAIAANF